MHLNDCKLESIFRDPLKTLNYGPPGKSTSIESQFLSIGVHMTKKDWFGIGYVSVWVMIWGTVGSLIDLPFLNADIYLAGSIGQITTFVITALLSIAIGGWLYPKVLKNNIIISALGLDSDENI